MHTTIGRTFAALAFLAGLATARADEGLIRSARSGAWSAASTWEGGSVPEAGARVQVRAGHIVEYDLDSDRPIRSIHVAGALCFAPDRDTRLDVGLIKIQGGDDASENGFDCDAHAPRESPEGPRPTLEVGTPSRPISAEHTARIRLIPVEGLDPETCPAIVCCGGRMEFHGAPMPRTWVKLGKTARPADEAIELAEPVPGWKPGDAIVLTASTRRQRKEGETLRPGRPRSIPPQTEERHIRAIDGTRVTLDRPLGETHGADEGLIGEVANLSRNVVVESADPANARGHTMYHRHSAGSISYSEFRGLGKEGVKGRYPIHFHLVGDTMRGSSVIGASIRDSGNRWITIHGTNRLVVRDCVGYRSVGHGFFLEDGTETLNVLDRNLAIQAFAGRPLPDQALAFDANTGAGFWWANSLNTFTRNVAAECDRYGFRYEATPSESDGLRRRVLGADGRRDEADIRTLPFLKFAGNEAHGQVYGINLGEGIGGVGPGPDRPFMLRDTLLWDCLWAIRSEIPAARIEGMTIDRCRYGIIAPPDGSYVVAGLTIRRTFVAGAAPETASLSAPKDRTPPVTIVTFVGPPEGGKRRIRGTSVDDGSLRRVTVNGREARFVGEGSAEWEITIDDPADGLVTARAEDEAGNVEPDPHAVRPAPIGR